MKKQAERNDGETRPTVDLQWSLAWIAGAKCSHCHGAGRLVVSTIAGPMMDACVCADYYRAEIARLNAAEVRWLACTPHARESVEDLGLLDGLAWPEEPDGREWMATDAEYIDYVTAEDAERAFLAEGAGA